MTTRVKQFVEQNIYHSHSGIFPKGAVEIKPKLGISGEYTDPPIHADAHSLYASIAALGPLRSHEDQMATALYGNLENSHSHAELGWYQGLYSGFVLDEKQRLLSSSGGVTTALLQEMLRLNMIDGVIHMRHADQKGMLFGYEISTTAEQISSGRKTRYFPGSLYEALETIRTGNGRYAVVGIPSFISELRRLAAFDNDVNDSIAFYVGLICGHQKTANYMDNLHRQIGIAPGQLIDIDFRHKVPGMPANNYSTRFVYRNGNDISEKVVPGRELFGTNWGWGMFKSFFSDFSDDAFNETADVVFGDAWLPQFTQDYRGTNVIIVRNPIVHKLLKQMMVRNEIQIDDLPADEMVRSQTALVRHARRERDFRLALIQGKGFAIPAMRPLPPTDISFGRKLIQRRRLQISRASHMEYQSVLQEGDWETFHRAMKLKTFSYKLIDKADRTLSRHPFEPNVLA